MMAKIEWYREMLEQEPGSRVFFPLAKLLIAAGRAEEATGTLRKGLERHPDFLEARLALISLLHGQAGTAPDGCAREVGEVIRLFKAYPAFWEAWAEAEQGNDLALALRFIGQAAASPDFSFSRVFERGLAASASAPRGVSPAPLKGAPEGIGAARNEENGAALSPLSGPVPRVETPSAPLAAPRAEADSSRADEGDEPVTLRTRSMADVLAEQGDIPGALEIYQELEAAAPTPEEAALLRERVMALASRVGAQAEAPASGQPGESGPDSTDGDGRAEAASQSKMLHLLETLADRLEARARA